MYLHRYLRYTPILAALLLFVVTLMNHVIFGPLSELDEGLFNMVTNCEKWWWTTLLHVQNYVNPNEIVSAPSKSSRIAIFKKSILVPFSHLVFVSRLATFPVVTFFDLASVEIRMEIFMDSSNSDANEFNLHLRHFDGLQRVHY